MQNLEKMEQRLAELEMKLTFQDNLLDTLNQALIEQQFVIDKMQLQLRYVAEKLKDIQPSNIASRSEETPPPHY
ncbi:MAG: SlyX family protein [Lonepinella koalarum]|nr:SlyX family protein [Lonepinella koalarum]